MSQFALTSGTLPEGYCPSSWQDLYQRMFSAGYGVFPDGLTSYVMGNTEPTADQRDLPWVRLDSSGDFDRIYIYNSGQWRAPHPVPASSSSRILWVGSAGDVDTFDGGAVGTVGDASGPMWAIDTAFEAKFPVGVGTFAASGAVAVLGTGGEDKHVLTETELPSDLETTVETNDHIDSGATSMGLRLLSDAAGSGTTVDVALNLSVAGNNTAHNNLPPYIGVYFLKRTARRFYIPA